MPTLSCRNCEVFSFASSCRQASPRSVQPPASKSCQRKLDSSCGTGVTHSVPIAKSSTASLMIASALRSEMSRRSGRVSRIASLSEAILSRSSLGLSFSSMYLNSSTGLMPAEPCCDGMNAYTLTDATLLLNPSSS